MLQAVNLVSAPAVNQTRDYESYAEWSKSRYFRGNMPFRRRLRVAEPRS